MKKQHCHNTHNLQDINYMISARKSCNKYILKIKKYLNENKDIL